MTHYDFDSVIDRSNTNALNTDGFRRYIFHADDDRTFAVPDSDFIRMWVADMEFAVAPEIRQAMTDRIDRKIFGYTGLFSSDYYDALSAWCRDRYGWSFPREELVISPGVVTALHQLIGDLVGEGECALTLTPAYRIWRKRPPGGRRCFCCSAIPTIPRDGCGAGRSWRASDSWR